MLFLSGKSEIYHAIFVLLGTVTGGMRQKGLEEGRGEGVEQGWNKKQKQATHSGYAIRISMTQ